MKLFLIWVIVFGGLIAVASGCGARHPQTSVVPAAYQSELDNARSLEHQGVMLSSDSLRVFSILHPIPMPAVLSISDSDLSYMIDLLNSRPIVDSPDKREFHFQIVASSLDTVAIWKPEQSNIVLQAIEPHLRGSKYEQISALHLLIGLARHTDSKNSPWKPSDRVKHAVGGLRSDKDIEVRNEATMAYRAITRSTPRYRQL